MKRAKKITIIVATVMFIFGIALCTLSLFLADFDFSRFETDSVRQQKSYIATEDFNSIEMNNISNDIKILPSSNSECKVMYCSGEKYGYDISVFDGVLKINNIDNRKWYDFINISFGDNETDNDVVIYLPKKEYKTAFIKTTSGDIEVCGIIGETINIESNSGDVDLKDTTCKTIKIKTTSGDLDIKNSDSDELDIKTTSGDIEVCGIIGETIDIESNSGDVDLKDTNCKTIKIKTTSGELDIKNSDADEFDIKTTSGDIECEILTPKIYDVNTNSGNIYIPYSDATGGKFSAKTTSGDVFVEYKN